MLNPSNDNLKIQQDKIRGVYVTPLTEEVVTCAKDVMRVIQRGETNRHISSTDFNLHSSRSHTLFQMVIESRERSNASMTTASANRRTFTTSHYGSAKGSKEVVKISQLNLIDLAGSEKAATNEDRRKEGAYINKSLLTLGTVISKLTDTSSGQHIPFRDSKLTRILQTALTGLAKVAVICTISPSQNSLEESVNTLKFASRVKRIAIHAKNEDVMDDKALIQKYRGEILELKKKLQGQENGGGENNQLLQQERLNHAEQMKQMRSVRNAMKERIDHLTRLILTSNNVVGSPNLGNSHLADTQNSSLIPPSPPISSSSSSTIPTTTAATVTVSAQQHQELEQRLKEQENRNKALQDQIKKLLIEAREKDSKIISLQNEVQLKDTTIQKFEIALSVTRAELEVNQMLNHGIDKEQDQKESKQENGTIKYGLMSPPSFTNGTKFP